MDMPDSSTAREQLLEKHLPGKDFLEEDRFRAVLTAFVMNRAVLQNCVQCLNGVPLEGGRVQAREVQISCEDCPAHVNVSISELQELRLILIALVCGNLPRGGGLLRQESSFVSKLALAVRILRDLGLCSLRRIDRSEVLQTDGRPQ